jgi:hypothetical protein
LVSQELYDRASKEGNTTKDSPRDKTSDKS